MTTMAHFLVILSASAPVPRPPASAGSASPPLDVCIGVVALALIYFHAEHLAEAFQQFLYARFILVYKLHGIQSVNQLHQLSNRILNVLLLISFFNLAPLQWGGDNYFPLQRNN